PCRLVTTARAAAAGTGSTFVDHGQYMANLYRLLGKDTVNSFYPEDHLHTSPAGARAAAEAFVKAVTCELTGGLKTYVNAEGYKTRGTCANGSNPSPPGEIGRAHV